MAIGLNLIFGVMRMVNLAHGDFIMLGAFAAFFAYTLWNMNPLVTMVFVFFLFILLGGALYYLVVPRLLRAQDPEMLSLILFFGLSQVIQALAVIAFGNNQRSIDYTALGSGTVFLFGQGFEESWVVVAAVSLLAIILVSIYLYATKLGVATRAVMNHREEAASAGISVHRVSAYAMGIGLALAAIAGVFSPFMIGSIDPTMGTDLTTTSFAIIIIGSLGNPIGTVVGGMIYGLSLMYMESYQPSWSSLVPYLLLFIILLLKPSGLLGRRMRNA
ncbi:amino acid ABC transporter [Ferroacidibacillus organovorans]|uniref:Amino acid ABC transporter n=2 Tax=Ferroacidibacillus organovorans TaxID=1765683 RepID=A0A124IVM3_9BACL|nr:amino acid ABC transporter [Ferroacidibacillus organovorans]